MGLTQLVPISSSFFGFMTPTFRHGAFHRTNLCLTAVQFHGCTTIRVSTSKSTLASVRTQRHSLSQLRVQRFSKQSEIAAQPSAVFSWHEQPGIVERLTPPWERVEVLEHASGLRVGSRVVFKIHTGPFSRLWVAEHTEYHPPNLFADIQRQGPFAYWYHRHRFEPTSRGTTLMTDEVDYALPMGWLGELVAGSFTRKKLERMFDYRHQVVAKQFADRSDQR